MNDPLPHTPPATAAPEDKLETLTVLYNLYAGVTGLFSLIPILHVGMGLQIIRGDFGIGDKPPVMMGWIFLIMGLIFIIGGMVCAVLFAMNAHRMRRRTHYTFCLIVSGISCIFMPLGTLLGVFTLVALTKPDIKAQFAPR